MPGKDSLTTYATGLDGRSGRAKPRPIFPELSRVRLAKEFCLGEGKTLPVGTSGTVVGVWAQGEAYEVEFSKPFHAVLTVPAQQLRKAA